MSNLNKAREKLITATLLEKKRNIKEGGILQRLDKEKLIELLERDQLLNSSLLDILYTQLTENEKNKI